MEEIKRNIPYQKRNFRGASAKGKFIGISVLNAKETILKKIIFSFIAYLCVSK